MARSMYGHGRLQRRPWQRDSIRSSNAGDPLRTIFAPRANSPAGRSGRGADFASRPSLPSVGRERPCWRYSPLERKPDTKNGRFFRIATTSSLEIGCSTLILVNRDGLVWGSDWTMGRNVRIRPPGKASPYSSHFCSWCALFNAVQRPSGRPAHSRAVQRDSAGCRKQSLEEAGAESRKF